MKIDKKAVVNLLQYEMTFADPHYLNKLDKLIDKVKALPATEDGWVSVENFLPPTPDEDILICRKDGFEDWMSIGNYHNKAFYNVWDWTCECYPTHWMPLPSPPTK